MDVRILFSYKKAKQNKNLTRKRNSANFTKKRLEAFIPIQKALMSTTAFIQSQITVVNIHSTINYKKNLPTPLDTHTNLEKWKVITI